MDEKIHCCPFFDLEGKRMIAMESCLYCETVWEKCVLLAQRYLSKAISIYPQTDALVEALLGCREEIALGSRYMNRGFYCPSPVVEYIITNMRRGRIAKDSTKTSQPTNRYIFTVDEKLRLAETFYPNGSKKTEFMFYENDVVYGIVFDCYGHVLELSVEQYTMDKIVSYLWVHFRSRPDSNIHWISKMTYETYDYKQQGYLITEFYDMEILPSFNQVLGKYIKSGFKVVLDCVIPNSRETLTNKQEVFEKNQEDYSLS